MGIRISIHNDSGCVVPVRGEVKMLGGAKLLGWAFSIPKDDFYTNVDHGVAASCEYILEVYVTQNGMKTTKKYSKQFRAPAVAGNLDLYVSDMMKLRGVEVKQDQVKVVDRDVKVGLEMKPKSIYGLRSSSSSSS
mmetsp:Transcript_21505/g.41750  ORF Transcript_21505/g.41750 Transcript_21505/m.41750 type:complete len:135 (+) Transcript_21505:115-519(+)